MAGLCLLLPRQAFQCAVIDKGSLCRGFAFWLFAGFSLTHFRVRAQDGLELGTLEEMRACLPASKL